MKKVVFIFSFLVLSSFLNSQAQSINQVGFASYYAHYLSGRRTANGDRYHQDSLTCAHRTLPFGTLLKVRNLSNDKEVVVEVTDRGPFSGKDKIVDLSYRAASELGMVNQGVAQVEISVCDDIYYPLRPKGDPGRFLNLEAALNQTDYPALKKVTDVVVHKVPVDAGLE
jgi:rare lipoprotein A